MINIFVVHRPEGNKQSSWKTDGQTPKTDISQKRKLLISKHRICFLLVVLKEIKNQNSYFSVFNHEI